MWQPALHPLDSRHHPPPLQEIPIVELNRIQPKSRMDVAGIENFPVFNGHA